MALINKGSDPAWKDRFDRRVAFDLAKRLKEEIQAAKRRDSHTLQGYFLANLEELRTSAKRNCKTLAGSADDPDAHPDDVSLEGEEVLRQSADDAAAQDSDESPEEDVEAPEPEGGDRDATVQTFRRLNFTAVQVNAIASVAKVTEASFHRVLPRQGDNVSPRLGCMPVEWSDDDYLSYAADADDLTDDCDDSGQCPVPPRRTPSEQGHSREATINAIVKTTRSAGTLFLAWLRLDLEGNT
jgi:hypothetical protein